jgi:phosphoenolpyruvate---glycerone phosphotransferase subunit DhaL
MGHVMQTVGAEHVRNWLQGTATVLAENRGYLNDLDAAIGDADHGTNIARGFAQVVEKLPTSAEQDIGALFKSIGMTLMSAVGGASGMLYGSFFLRAANAAAGKTELKPAELVQALTAGVEGIAQRGRAVAGDKTMLDAWEPALLAMRAALDADEALSAALAAGATAAEAGMRATIPMQARKGRASYLGERSIGHQDPGATSTCLLVQALADTVK